jgi:prepilin-type N-terminal cleavage/methylation domain-containing protein
MFLDSGMSLVEVIVAIAIISVIALSTASLTINGMSLASAQQSRQVAVTVASGAMEAATAQPIGTIYKGRTQAAVQAAYNANTAVPGIATVSGVTPTYQVWDTSGSVTSEALPITSGPITQNGTRYTTTTLVGSCYQPRTGGDCARLSSNPTTPPTSTPTGYMQLIRVVVVVRWTGKTCSSSGCLYSATTLLDPGKDLEWVTHE